MSRRVHDALVVGAGSVGATAALGLARAGLSVAVVEARSPEPYVDASEVDLRVYALSPASQRVLEHLGVWAGIRGARVGQYRRMQVWSDAGSIAFDAAELGQSELGHIVEGSLLSDRLWSALAADPGIECCCPDQINDLLVEREQITVVLASGRRLRTRLLIAADGSRSPLRARFGLEQQGHAYAQSALVTHVRCEQGHRDTAWQRFTPDGPLALLPLADGRCSVVWSQPTDMAERRMQLSEDAFCEELTVASEQRLGRVLACDRRASFELRMALSQRYIAERFVLLGDAAHSVHPLAGQGMNLGMLDAACLIDLLARAHAGNADPGARSLLRRYERQRISENTLAAWSFDTLNRVFTRPPGVLRSAAGIGMSVLGRSAYAKGWLMAHASGTDSLPAGRF